MRLYGSVGPNSRLSVRGYDPQRGWSVTVTTEGTTAQVQALEASLKAQGIKYRATYSSPLVASVEAYYDHSVDGTSLPAQAQSVWSLDSNQLQKDIWEHPKITAITGGFENVGAVCNFRRAMEGAISGKIVEPDDQEAWVAIVLWSELSSDVTQLLQRLATGHTTYEQHTYVLRNTLTYPRGYVFTPDYGNENKLITSALLQSREPTIPFTLPPNRYWLTRGYQLEQQSDGRILVTREWWETDLDLWLYDQIT